MTWIFWLSLMTLGFTYAGYPLLLAVVARLRSADEENTGEATLHISVVLVARDEQDRIAARIENLLASSLVGGQVLEIVLVCDGCSDQTAQRAKQAGGQRLKLIELQESRGKANGINVGIGAASGEIVVFADARQRFDRQAIERLVATFDDPRVGAVSGSLEIEASDAGVGAGIDFYWKLEKFIRSSEASIDSCIGCTGAIYAIRRELFEPLPEDTILDDVVVPMRIAVAGARVKFLGDAVAYDPQKLSPDSERRRKTRTLAGNFQMLFRYPGWLLPWRNRLWWQLIAHKYLRLAGPVLLLLCLVANGALLTWHPFYILTFSGQLAFYLLAVIGLLLPNAGLRVVSVASGFLFLQWLCVRGFFEWLRRALTIGGRKASGTW